MRSSKRAAVGRIQQRTLWPRTRERYRKAGPHLRNEVRVFLERAGISRHEEVAVDCRHQLLGGIIAQIYSEWGRPHANLFDRIDDSVTQLAAGQVAKGDALIKLALEGDADADWVLCQVAGNYIAARCSLPSALRRFAADRLRRAPLREGQGRQGRKKSTNLRRDAIIIEAIEMVMRRGNLLATRSETTSKLERADSGCSVVAEVLRRHFGFNLHDTAINAVWDKHKRLRSPPLG